MEAFVCLRSKQTDYIDVDVYVPYGDGEWNFSIFKDMETGGICLGDHRWAEDKDASFEEVDEPPSFSVWTAVIGAMPEVLDVIRKAEEV